MENITSARSLAIRERIFRIIPLIKSIPAMSLAAFFSILYYTGIFDFETSEERVSLLYGMAEQYFPIFILPLIIIPLIILYANHRKIRQKSLPIIKVEENTDLRKTAIMEEIRIKRYIKLILFELRNAAIRSIILLVPAAVLTLFSVMLLDNKIYGEISIRYISLTLFACIGLAFLFITRLRNILENMSDWEIMSSVFLNILQQPGFQNHGLMKGNEPLVRWVDAFWPVSAGFRFARNGMGVAFEVDGFQFFLFADTCIASFLYIFGAARPREYGTADINELKTLTGDLKEHGLALTLFSDGILITANEDRIYSILKDCREDDGSVLERLIHRLREIIRAAHSAPGPMY